MERAASHRPSMVDPEAVLIMGVAKQLTPKSLAKLERLLGDELPYKLVEVSEREVKLADAIQEKRKAERALRMA